MGTHGACPAGAAPSRRPVAASLPRSACRACAASHPSPLPLLPRTPPPAPMLPPQSSSRRASICPPPAANPVAPPPPEPKANPSTPNPIPLISDPPPQAKEIMYHKANLNRIMADYTGQPLAKIEVDTDRDRYMSPLEAKEYGIIDHIIGGEEAVFNVKGSMKRFPKVGVRGCARRGVVRMRVGGWCVGGGALRAVRCHGPRLAARRRGGWGGGGEFDVTVRNLMAAWQMPYRMCVYCPLAFVPCCCAPCPPPCSRHGNPSTQHACMLGCVCLSVCPARTPHAHRGLPSALAPLPPHRPTPAPPSHGAGQYNTDTRCPRPPRIACLPAAQGRVCD